MTDLQVDEALRVFVSRVDEVLRDLEQSAGSPTKVGGQTINASSLGNGSSIFSEPTELYTQYNRVHNELTTLSKTLHLQIEAYGIAAKGAADGFQNLEEEQRRRFWEIQRQIRELGRDDSTGGRTETSDDRSGVA
ncbi:hypothetical protein ACFRI7_26755 [Streptomyces sp. NPDC056716]|uniref:hypothetical protein n=1 Tax=unclassified Streptomyces TaxID=2593676 RepID=UPI0036CB13D0